MGRVNKRNIDGVSERELLRTPLGRLELDLDRSPVMVGVNQLRAELRARGLRFCPHFWLSDEWFCPDGVPGIAVPFYLVHPRLIALEEQWIGYAEGSDHEWLMKLLRHETGHAIENAYGLRRHRFRVAAFGNIEVPYPKSYLPQPFSRQYVTHLNDQYAQSHPAEDFAETFAIWLTPGSRWRQRYPSGTVRRKLESIEAIMSEIGNRRPLLTNKFRVDPIEKSNQTLGNYLASKQRRLGLGSSTEMDANLRAIFSPAVGRSSSPHQHAARFLRTHRPTLSRALADQMGEYKYRIDGVIARLADRARELELRVKPGQSLRPVLDVVARQALEDLSQKRHHIIL